MVSGDAETVLSNKDAQEKYFGRRFDATSIIEGKEAFESSAELRETGIDHPTPNEEQVDDQEDDDRAEPEQAA